MNKQNFSFDNILDIYPRIYNLPVISLQKIVPSELLNILQKEQNFLTIAMYNSSGKIVLTPKQQLPFGNISSKNIQENINIIARKTIPNIKLGEIEPISFIEQNYYDETGRKHTQYGIGFMGRIRNESEIEQTLNKNILIGIENLSTHTVDYISQKDVLSYCLHRLNSIQQKEIQNEEIDTNEKTKLRYIIHKEIVKKFILTNKRKRKKEFTKLVSALLKGCKSIVDASCGDSELLLNIAKENNENLSFAIGNDISWSQISLIKNDNSKISFTNHDSTNLPFKDNAFDAALCCNTLHHMPTDKHLADLFKNLLRVAEKVVIVEIENPEKTGGFPKFLNKYYYEGFLRDVGEHYLTQKEFHEKVILNCKHEADIKFSNFKNIQGNYMIAEINKRRSK